MHSTLYLASCIQSSVTSLFPIKTHSYLGSNLSNSAATAKLKRFVERNPLTTIVCFRVVGGLGTVAVLAASRHGFGNI